MITDSEWNIISQKAFPKKSVKAPPFLWTRILARIEAEETRRGLSWWAQWQWVGRLTATVGLIVGLAAFYLLRPSLNVLDATTIQLASYDSDPGESDLLPGADS